MEQVGLFLDLEKEFKSSFGNLTITRGEYEDCTIPLVAVEFSDEQMKNLVDNINLSMYSDYDEEQLKWLQIYRGDGKGLTREQLRFADKMSEREFEYFETCATKMGMRYYEELESWEYEKIKNAKEQANC